MSVVVVLAGGYATRLRPLSYTRPKVLLPIVGKPLIDYIIEGVLKLRDVKRIVFSLRYMADKIMSYISSRWGELADVGGKIMYVLEERPLGDAGPLALIASRYHALDGTFVVIYGDVFMNVDLGKVLDVHRRKRGVATIVLTKVEGDLSRYGVASIDDDMRVTKFVEKPRGYQGPGLVNAGVYVFEPEVLKLLPSEAERQLKISTDLMPKLIERFDVYAYVHEGFWFDIGTHEDYLRANFKALEQFGMTCSASDAEIKGPCFIDRDVKIGRGCEIGPYAVILGGCRIGDGVRIARSVVFSGSVLSNSSYVTDSIIGERTYIGRWARVDGAVIGDEVYVGDYVFVARGVKVGPYREVVESIYEENKIVP